MNTQTYFTVFDTSDETYATNNKGNSWGSEEKAIRFDSQKKAEEWINSTIHKNRIKTFEIHVIEYKKIIIEREVQEVTLKIPYSNNQ